MTDTPTFLNNIIAWNRRTVEDLENMRMISDRIGADSAMATNLAAAATAAGRKDLQAADFDNLKIFIDLWDALLNAQNGDTITVTINTGGKAKLAVYRII